jgi:hypothetical protein
LQGELEEVLRRLATQVLEKVAIDEQFTSFMGLADCGRVG